MHALSNMDLAAAAWFLFAWLGFNLLIDVSPLRKKTLSSAMETYRRGWMRAMSLREVRIMDTSIMSGLQQGTAFFASTSLLAIGGGFALLDATERIVQVAGDLSIPVADSRALWEIKVLALMLIFAYGFFKFGWAYRLFNYASIVMGAVPQEGQASDEVIAKMAAQAGSWAFSPAAISIAASERCSFRSASLGGSPVLMYLPQPPSPFSWSCYVVSSFPRPEPPCSWGNIRTWDPRTNPANTPIQVHQTPSPDSGHKGPTDTP